MTELSSLSAFMDDIKSFRGEGDEYSEDLNVAKIFAAHADSYVESYRQSSATIPDGKSLIVGDLHLSDRFRGQHKNYQLVCVKVLNLILDKLRTGEFNSLIFLGDLFGVSENHIKDASFMALIMDAFSEMNRLTQGRVFSVRGNHDRGGATSFDIFLKAGENGLIKNPGYIDMGESARLHLINWGSEEAELNIKPGVKNIGLGHNFYNDSEGIKNSFFTENQSANLDTLENLHDLSMIISGHIHTPKNYKVTLPDMKRSIQIVYPGSPTRDKERIDNILLVVLTSNEGNFKVNARAWADLPKHEDMFWPEATPSEVEGEHISADVDQLREILLGISSGADFGSIEEAIKNFPGSDERAKEKALEIFQNATA